MFLEHDIVVTPTSRYINDSKMSKAKGQEIKHRCVLHSNCTVTTDSTKSPRVVMSLVLCETFPTKGK